MLFQLIDGFLDGVCDVLQYGPLGALDIATSACPGAERMCREITGHSIAECLEPISTSPLKTNEKKRVDATLFEKLNAGTKVWDVVTGMNPERFEELIENIKNSFSVESDNINLGLLFDRHKLNFYGRIILDKVGADMYEAVDGLNTEERLKLVSAFKEKCQREEGDKYSFIFWALMVLTVDDTDKDKHLAQICDLSRLLKINEEEMENIIQLIRVVYRNKFYGGISNEINAGF